MKLIFAGTPHFAAQSLRALIAAGHHIELVLTQPDRPSGRGMNLKPSPVKALAEEMNLPVFQPSHLKDAESLAKMKALSADAMIVAAYGLILPQAVLDVQRLGCINIHASLLPRWRGAAPIQRAILAGDDKTGVCIMQMQAGLDTGPVLRSAALPITSSDNAASLHDKLSALGAQLIVDTLAELPISATAQASEGVTYAEKIRKEEARIDWKNSAAFIARQVRAFNPSPAAYCLTDQGALKLWQVKADIASHKVLPGEIVHVDKTSLVLATGEGVLHLLEVQKAGGKRLPIAQFLAGNPLLKGSFFS